MATRALLLLIAITACGDDGDGNRCGDLAVAGAEQCDDGNGEGGDGCENDCTFSCTMAAECADSTDCTTETCDTTTHRCVTTPAGDGDECEVDDEPLTQEICVAGACVASTCGDQIVDARDEECDDGNTTPGDGCQADCTVTVSAFRAISLRFADPHTYTDGATGCEDGTAGFDMGLQEQIDMFMLNIVMVFRPLAPATPITAVDIYFGADCVDGSPRPSCQPGTSAAMPALANNYAGTCYQADASTLNPLYTPPNSPMGSCFVTDPQPLAIPFGTVALPFQDAVAAASYQGGPPPTGLMTGVFAGFLTETDASTIEFSPGFPLYRFLAAGGATGSSCSTEDDRDMNGGTAGFWVYLDLEAAEVDWTMP